MISGSKPVDQRHLLHALMDANFNGKKLKSLTPSLNPEGKVNIFVASARAVACNFFMGELLPVRVDWKLADSS